MERRKRVFGPLVCLLVLSAGALAAACGGSSQSAASPTPSNVPPATPPPDDVAPTKPDTAQSGGPEKPSGDKAADPGAPPAAAGAQVALVELCEEGCKKIKAKCAGSSYDNCHMNCAQYEHGPKGCEKEAREALECAKNAEDVTCVNIAPEICAFKFRKVVACSNGTTLEAKEEAGAKTPPGWERYSAKSAGFSALMPKGVTEGQEGGQPQFTTKEGEGTYNVRILPAPKEKPTQKNMLGVAMGVLGKCNRNLKLYGMVDRPEKVFIRFDAGCPDGSTWRGAFVIVGPKMYMPFVSAPKGVKTKPEIDAFIYSFETGK
jgi:hypothetical protein